MKKSILLVITGLAVSVTQSFGLGVIQMDNYSTSGPYVTYGPGGLGPVGQGLGVGWTAGLYYALGDVRASISADPAGFADPATLGVLTLGSGPGSTAGFGASAAGTPGAFFSSQVFQINDNPGDTITVMIVAYNGSSYATSLNRGHSAAFTMTTSLVTDLNSYKVGDYMPGFS